MPSRTEKEKMLAGERYNIHDLELDLIRQETKKKLSVYNGSTEADDRQALLKALLGTIGENVVIWPPFQCVYGENIHIGNNVFLNMNCFFIDNNLVKIGSHTMLGPGVQIYTAAHDLQAESRVQGYEVAQPIEIEESVWIGGSAILLPGVKIGKNSVVGAGAVVTRDVPPNVVVAGNPARILREIDQASAGS